jgi:hypothetical protein
MSCLSCASDSQALFPAELMIHLNHLKNPAKLPDRPDILVFAKVLVCLQCGFSSFIAPETELGLLVSDTLE